MTDTKVEIINLSDETKELDYVVTIKTKRNPDGFRYIRADCLNKKLLDIKTAAKELMESMQAKKIII